MTTDSVPKTTVQQPRRLDGRRHGQGRGDARAVAGHDARRPHHRRRRARRRARPGAADGDGVSLRAGRLRRLPVDQRHRDRPGQRRERRHPDLEALRPRRCTAAAPTSPCSCWPTPRGRRKDIAIAVRNAASVEDAVTVGRAVRAQQPAQDGAVRQRPELGPGAGRDRHHRRGLRGRPGRRHHQRRLGLPGRRDRRPPARASTSPARAITIDVDLSAGGDAGDDLDQRPLRSPTSTRTRRTRHEQPDRAPGPDAP